ncbi:MAG: hypothetical protein HN623_03485, partial [Bdellovibrionales bacterium]|nr:hypothetical protein [Bdellovibrionales bacterium]
TKLGLTSVENPPSKILAKGMISTMQSAGMEIDQGGFLDGLNSCVKTENRNCFSTLIKGVVDNLTDTWGMVKSVGGWLKKAPGRFWNWTKKKVSSAKNYFNSLDSFSTMRMHMASAMSDVDLAQWAKNRWSAITTFAGNLGGAISKMFTEAMVSDYGCPEKVRGKCVTPMDVNCMNCRDYMRAFCGFVGYIAPEILLAISSGGATAAGGFIKRLLSNSSKMTKKVSRRMNRLMNPIRNKMVLNAHRGHSLRMKEINSSLAKFKPKTMGVNYLKTTAKADKKLVGKACNLYW